MQERSRKEWNCKHEMQERNRESLIFQNSTHFPKILLYVILQDKMEDFDHLFGKCEWFQVLWIEINKWLGVQIPQAEPRKVVQSIRRKQWSKMKKETVVAVHGAMIYLTWQVRNWKIFQATTVNTDLVVKQIQFVVKESVGMFIGSKHARNCIDFLEAIASST
ncbi:uncharacterized protein LOC132624014 [Lycium barbarum]|uniref:uncharacterized protein LOC132624014 n=1 Tax=Lycium barbarum TaxID=112863 RepID=UPI00293EE8BD|nr:uncharacterized protein LOC132624014 [Lycium barbarum]